MSLEMGQKLLFLHLPPSLLSMAAFSLIVLPEKSDCGVVCISVCVFAVLLYGCFACSLLAAKTQAKCRHTISTCSSLAAGLVVSRCVIFGGHVTGVAPNICET